MSPAGAHVHLAAPDETLWAVVVGALLATVGGFVATLLERAVHRRERERNAALLLGGILSAMTVLMDVARGSKAHGEPFGSMTLRVLRALRREVEAYDRTRAVLYDLADSEVRTRIHALMVRLTLSLEGVLEANDALTSLSRLGSGAERSVGPPGGEGDSAATRAALEQQREAAFAFMLSLAREIEVILARLQPVARQDFTAHDDVTGNPFRDAAPDGRP